ncbi:dolichyl-diphosphooligosaccharide--protein glycosyltransferase 48 kDa subunit-like isoform X1 [Chenopodium quinoa]|uniref:dolichyl-diphosphooligosaccharide--protein glycosyltransferase 48 kDa subunit-like isoform X1 n=1 Tax=Chenopodium quinoa TaxID=63459 RepID=UPI000B795F04|nr:dolichyl-diphosphooligosaccharide--protein glycosyltransferase 48 kDa subunit-like isoform X1 [Chenopodium quinoa]
MAKLLCIFTIFSLLISLSTAFDPVKPTDRKILVILEDASYKSSHSIYFNSLQSRGYNLDFKLSDDRKIALQRYGHYLYDGLILFSPSADSIGDGSLKLNDVLDFVDSGHDLIVAADANASDFIRNVASECGIDFEDDTAAVVVDHTSYSVSEIEGDHTLIASDDIIKSDVILWREKIEAPVLFRGIAHSVNAASSLALKVLSASPAAYSANPNNKLSKPPALTGTSISLVSVVQARNNARVLISGSLDMFSDRFLRSSVQKAGTSFKYEKSGNEQFLTELSKWIFHERGHLKAVNVKHHKLGETNEPSIYRIKDDLEYSVEIYEWSGTSWEPYVADDVQLQFYLMSPYVLKTLSKDKTQGLYHTSFKVPDVYGVFQFKIEYQRLGYTSLSLAKQIPVRPYNHDEYERFLPVAFPYYGASFSTMAAFFIFSILYLYHK